MSALLPSCFLEGHLGLCRVSNAAICIPSLQVSLWAAGPKLHPKQRRIAIYANYGSFWWFFPYTRVLSVTSAECDGALYLCESVSWRKCTD